MKNNNLEPEKSHFTSRASLIGLGVKMEQLKIMETIGQYVKVKQKTVKDSPLEKLTDGLITILAGGQSLSEANKRVGAEPVLQRAFGRERCAEQSVISQTLDACTTENVSQMEQAMKVLYQEHSAGYGHNYERDWQLLDIDLSGQPCGPKAAFATKGYFARQRNRRGRQLGRVWATWYDEIVIDQIYSGKTTLHAVLPELMTKAETILALDARRRQRTIVRIDAHGGHVGQVNQFLADGYQVHTKEGNWRRVRQLVASISEWHSDPREAGRHVAWVAEPADEYERPVYRVAVRTPKKKGQWGYGVIVSSLAPETVGYLAGFTPEQLTVPLNRLLAYVYFYDLRGGGVETGFKEDKQGLGITKRNKKRFEAQQMLTQLNALAHNLLIWFRAWLAQRWATVSRFGLLRFIRDVLHLHGSVFLTNFSRSL